MTNKKMTYTSLRYLWPCIRREFIIQALKFLKVFPRQLRSSKPNKFKIALKDCPLIYSVYSLDEFFSK